MIIRSTPGPEDSNGSGIVRFGSMIHLTKGEAFAACQALADAGQVLLRAGSAAESNALADLFELFEERLVAD